MSIEELQDELRTLNYQTNTTRARLADAILQHQAENSDVSSDAKNAWELRKSRRNAEMEDRLIYSIPPGPWDDDLDKFHKKSYPFDMKDGYKGQLVRNPFWSWNGYITVPSDHPAIGQHYDFFNRYGPNSMPSSPIELTYSDGALFGFDHSHSWDVIPYNPFETVCEKKETYKTFEDVKRELEILLDYFNEVGGMTGWKPKPPFDPRKSWVSIVKGP